MSFVSPVLTPSEIVLIHGAHFARRKLPVPALGLIGVAVFVASSTYASGTGVLVQLLTYSLILLACGVAAFVWFRPWRLPQLTASIWKETVLFDGRTAVASDQLVSSIVKAALLSNEQAGVIRLELTAGRSPAAVAVPVATGPRSTWPAATLESRLAAGERMSVSDMAFDWLADESQDPWTRALEQIKATLVIRGVATVGFGRSGMRTYSLTDEALALAASSSPQPVIDMLEACKRDRADLWQALDTGVKSAIGKRRSREEHHSEADPWLEESAVDQRRFQVHRPAIVAKARWTIPAGAALAILDWWMARQTGLEWFALTAAAVLTACVVVLSLPLGFARQIVQRVNDAIARKLPVPMDLPDPASMPWPQHVGGTLLLVGLVLMMALIVRVASPVLFLGLAAAGAYLAYRLLRGALTARAAVAISAHVSGKGVRATAGEDVSPPAGPVVTSTRIDLLVTLDVVRADSLPATSAESRRTLEAIGHRAPAIRTAYRKAIIGLSSCATMVALFYWLTGPVPLHFAAGEAGSGWTMPERFPVVWLVMFAITMALVTRRGAAWARSLAGIVAVSMATGAQVSGQAKAVDETKASIRPVLLPLLGGWWVTVILVAAAVRYSALTQPAGLLLTGVLCSGVAVYLYWSARAATAVERQFPFTAPLNLLALRVFGSPHLADFLNLTSGWQRLGTRQMLDGPDTIGAKWRDLINYFAGRLNDSIVKDTTELERELRKFQRTPDSQLRFPVNSMQCSDGSWKAALRVLLDAADVVVIDLSGLTPANRGVAYELGQVLEHVALGRLVPLVDDSTDLDVLQQVVSRGWSEMTNASPNHGLTSRVLRLYHVGGSFQRLPSESAYDWKKRLKEQIDTTRLVCLLFDAAQPRRSTAAVDPVRDRQSIRWSRVAMPVWLRRTRNVAFGAFCLLMLTISSCRLVG